LKCYIILPCYNEAKNLRKLVKSIDEALRENIQYKIIAVNDGSTDNTKEVLLELSSKYPIKLIEHARNMGLAKALETGFQTVLEEIEDVDYVIFMDSDNTHDPKYIPLMTSAAKNFDVVIGSRYIKNGRQINVPVLRVFMSKAINYLIKFLLKLKIRDFTSGYRCFRASTIKKLHKAFGGNLIESQGFEVSFEILLKTLACGSSIGEIPITLDYSLKNGESKMRTFPTILRYMKFILNFKGKLKNIYERCGLLSD